jgi:tartrate dehydratase alpha subunit/fumarate hydratase class I-like protein
MMVVAWARLLIMMDYAPLARHVAMLMVIRRRILAQMLRYEAGACVAVVIEVGVAGVEVEAGVAWKRMVTRMAMVGVLVI